MCASRLKNPYRRVNVTFEKKKQKKNTGGRVELRDFEFL